MTVPIVEKERSQMRWFLLAKECLEENRKKQSRGQHKQRMKKIDILEYLQEKGFVIGYTSICNLINRLEQRQSRNFYKAEISTWRCV